MVWLNTLAESLKKEMYERNQEIKGMRDYLKDRVYEKLHWNFLSHNPTFKKEMTG